MSNSERMGVPVIIAVNKTDAASAVEVQQAIDNLREYTVLQEAPVVPVSACVKSYFTNRSLCWAFVAGTQERE